MLYEFLLLWYDTGRPPKNPTIQIVNHPITPTEGIDWQFCADDLPGASNCDVRTFELCMILTLLSNCVLWIQITLDHSDSLNVSLHVAHNTRWQLTLYIDLILFLFVLFFHDKGYQFISGLLLYLLAVWYMIKI